MNDKHEPSLRELADAAFLQATYKAIERAEATGTTLVIWEDGAMKEITPADARERLAKHSEQQNRRHETSADVGTDQ